MNFNTLKQFRQQVYQSFERGSDALFNLCDALLSESHARSLPELSQSPFFTRQWPSLYQALQDGYINVEALREAGIDALLSQLKPNEPVWISLDSSNIARPEARTSADRGIIHVSNLPRASKPISVGWQFSTLMLLPEEPSSWVGILDQQRIATQHTAIEVAMAQLKHVVPLLKRPVIILADRWYATAEFLRACQELGCSVLVRLKSNRKLYRRAPDPTGKRGRPAQHGTLFQPKRPETLGTAEALWVQQERTDKQIRISRWSGLHFRHATDVEVSGIRIVRAYAKNTKRDPRESWFVLLGNPGPLQHMASIYARRFSQEHGYRFLKQDLLWTRAHVRTPQQFERWSLLVAVVMNQLRLARELGQALYRPWERIQRPMTPGQLRRQMGSILLQVGTPVRSCQTRGKSPGRANGFHPKPAPRYHVIVKSKKKVTSKGS